MKTLAALVLVTATNWFSSIFPVTCGAQDTCMCEYMHANAHTHMEGRGQKAEGETCSAIKKHVLTSNALWDFPFNKDRHRSGLLVNESQASLAFQDI